MNRQSTSHTNITLDRWYGLTDTDIDLHFFTDASKITYGLACYIRFKVNNQLKCSFVMSKCKLAPVYKISKSIPQLELQASQIASFLKQKITTKFKIPIKETFIWTDSIIVLHCSQNEDRSFGTYISYRVNEILENTEYSERNYVVDKTSIYQTFKQLSLEKFWFNGAAFLLNNDFNIETENEKLSVNSINITESTLKIYTQLGILLKFYKTDQSILPG